MWRHLFCNCTVRGSLKYCQSHHRCDVFAQAYFLDCCLDMFYDGVPNVRLHALNLLPRLKQTIELPQDVRKLVRRDLLLHD